MSRHPDVLILGGGVIGLSVAWELAGEGVSVDLLERGRVGREASWAGAGMLPPGDLEAAVTPLDRLRGLSHALWPRWSERLRADTGVDNGFARPGTLHVRTDAGRGSDGDRIAPGVRAEPIAGDEVRRLEPHLSSRVTTAVHLPDGGQVRNPRHVRALRLVCERAGVRVLERTPAHRLRLRDGRITGVDTPSGHHHAGTVVVCGGAWSGGLLETVGFSAPVRPVRGQIVLFRSPAPPLARVVEQGSRYLVPRSDGRTLVGSVEEEAGFEVRTTPAAVDGLTGFARDLVPALADAEVEQSWAGLRPGSPDGLPLLGPVPGIRGLFVAAGHHRNGLQMSPGTGRLIARLVTGRDPGVSLDGLTADRFDP